MTTPWLGMILHWFGPLPSWVESLLVRCEANPCARWFLFGEYVHRLGSGPNWSTYEMSLHDLGQCARKRIHRACADKLDGQGAGDYQPAFGELFAPWLQGLGWWGWADWDIVPGRLEEFFTPSVQLNADVISTHPQFINGTFSIMRNVERVNRLYRHDMRPFFSADKAIYTERLFTDIVRQHPNIWASYLPIEGNDRTTPNATCRLDGDRLMVRERPRAKEEERALFHFVRSKAWPL